MCGCSSRVRKEVSQEWNTYRVGVLQRGTAADISVRNVDIVERPHHKGLRGCDQTHCLYYSHAHH